MPRAHTVDVGPVAPTPPNDPSYFVAFAGILTRKEGIKVQSYRLTDSFASASESILSSLRSREPNSEAFC